MSARDLPRFVIVTSGPYSVTILKDGKDISREVTEVKVEQQVGDIARVTLTYLASSVVVDTEAREP